jgi:hypothetical protein
MNKYELTDYLRDILKESLVKGTIKTLIEPPGRKPREKDVLNSKFYNSLDDTQKDRVNSIISDAIDFGIFEILVMLDNCGSIIDNTGHWELYFVKDDDSSEKTLINDMSEDFEELHGLYNSVDE